MLSWCDLELLEDQDELPEGEGTDEQAQDGGQRQRAEGKLLVAHDGFA
jgi:hypothetical protein